MTAFVCNTNQGCYEPQACEGSECTQESGEAMCEQTCETIQVGEGEPDLDLCTLTTCNEVSEALGHVKGANSACIDTTDCSVTTGSFDPTCDCGDVVATSGLEAIGKLHARWDALSCDPDCGPDGSECGYCDCQPASGATCDGGKCQPTWE